MSYKRKPIYEFDNKDSVGLDKIPDGSKVVVKNYNGAPREFVKNDPTKAIVATHTVAEVVTSDVTKTGSAPAEVLEALDANMTGCGYSKRVNKSDRC